MIKHNPAWMILRMATGFAIGLSLLFWLPATWPGVVAPAVTLLVDASPYLENTRTRVESDHVVTEGMIRVNMTLQNGEKLPPVPGTWKKHTDQSATLLMVTLAVWMAPTASIRRRLIALPVSLLIAALASGLSLITELHVVALHTMGYEWLATAPLANTQENLRVFERMEQWYDRFVWIKAFLDGGGRLFLGIIAGLAGYAWPTRAADPGK